MATRSQPLLAVDLSESKRNPEPNVVNRIWRLYPQSGVLFGYYIPQPPYSKNIFFDEKDKESKLPQRILEYADRIKREYPDAKYFYIFPKESKDSKTPNDPIHRELLNLVKFVPLSATDPNQSLDTPIQIRYQLRNFFPGSPQAQNRWMWTNPSDDINTMFVQPLAREPTILSTEKMLEIKIQQAEGKIHFYDIQDPEDSDSEDFLVVKSTQSEYEQARAERKRRIDVQNAAGRTNTSDDNKFYYCGDMQLAWEASWENNENGSFEKCFKSYIKSEVIRKKYGLKKQVFDYDGETVEDLTELLDSEPVALLTLNREISSLENLIRKREGGVAELERKLRDIETKTPGQVDRRQLETRKRKLDEIKDALELEEEKLQENYRNLRLKTGGTIDLASRGIIHRSQFDEGKEESKNPSPTQTPFSPTQFGPTQFTPTPFTQARFSESQNLSQSSSSSEPLNIPSVLTQLSTTPPPS